MVAQEETDVLIVGAGSAGLMAALCAAAYGLNVRVIDKRPRKLDAGHADGLHARMLEILNSFGLADIYIQQGHTFTHTFTWVPDQKGRLIRNDSLAQPWSPPSVYTSVTLSQARTANIFLDYIENNSNIEIERSKCVKDLSVKSGREYPVEVSVVHVADQKDDKLTERMNNIRLDQNVQLKNDSQDDTEAGEIIKAKYVVACDGAHSLIRQKLGIPMVGSDADVIWGVLDIVPITDFPGVRYLNTIVSMGAGLLWVPRENGIVRIYCVLGAAKTDAEGKLIRSSVNPEMILQAVNGMLHPYKLSFKICEWWAAYQVGQRVTRENTDDSGHVFLTGDAVHTHSPQAGQGMNVSMADTYNLMWKLNLVLKGLASPKLLQTYREERLPLGQQLVDFDRSFAAIMSGRTPPPPPEGTEAAEMALESIGKAYQLIIHGIHVIYPPSCITLSLGDEKVHAKPYFEKAEMPPGIVTGMRMPSYQVTKHCDLGITQLATSFKSDGRFKVVVFAGDVSRRVKMQRIKVLATKMEEIVQTYEISGEQPSTVINTIVVHTANPLVVNLLDFPAVCRIYDDTKGYNYDNVFCARETKDRFGQTIVSAYDKYGVDPGEGRIVLLRPDGYVAYQGPLGDTQALQTYFDAFMIRRTDTNAVRKI